MKKRILMTIIALSAIIFHLNAQGQGYYQRNQVRNHPKFVFLFIGDGMGHAQVAAAEAWLASQEEKIGSEPLSFTKFPVMGMATTYSANSFVTCSSASGTALSTGFKQITACWVSIPRLTN